ncbi:hypothetical protein D3C85_1415290 [compost metagenome]
MVFVPTKSFSDMMGIPEPNTAVVVGTWSEPHFVTSESPYAIWCKKFWRRDLAHYSFTHTYNVWLVTFEKARIEDMAHI